MHFHVDIKKVFSKNTMKQRLGMAESSTFPRLCDQVLLTSIALVTRSLLPAAIMPSGTLFAFSVFQLPPFLSFWILLCKVSKVPFSFRRRLRSGLLFVSDLRTFVSSPCQGIGLLWAVPSND